VAPFVGSALTHAGLVVLSLAVTFPVAQQQLQRRFTPLFLPPPEVAASPAPPPILRTPPPPALRMPVLPSAAPAPSPEILPEPIRPMKAPAPSLLASAIPVPAVAVRPTPAARAAVFPAPVPTSAAPGSAGRIQNSGFEQAAPATAGIAASAQPHIGSFEAESAPRATSVTRRPADRAGFGEARLLGPTAVREEKGVPSAGFGDARATVSTNPAQSIPMPSAGGFAAVRADAARPPMEAQVAGPRFEQASVQVPANRQALRSQPEPRTAELEILEKPRPQYNEEGRRLRIEGDVLLEALLTATGHVAIQRIVRGLGHGLDESAVKAAMQIHFRPAMQGGQAVDTVAVLHVEFRLAY
jgi:TonB family protein